MDARAGRVHPSRLARTPKSSPRPATKPPPSPPKSKPSNTKSTSASPPSTACPRRKANWWRNPENESQRDSGLKPRIARCALPWVMVTRRSQPQRGCVLRRPPIRRNPVGVDEHFVPCSQSSSCLATLETGNHDSFAQRERFHEPPRLTICAPERPPGTCCRFATGRGVAILAGLGVRCASRDSLRLPASSKLAARSRAAPG